MTEHLSDLALDALRRTGVTEGADHLGTCARCRSRQAALAAEDAVFEARFVPEQLAVDTLAAAERPVRRWWPRIAVAAAAFAAVVFVVWPRGTDVRTKGAADVVALHVLDGDRRAPVLGPVDPRARLAVQVRGPGFARVLWGSSPGRWDALFPAADARAWRVEANSWLPNEVVLDGAPETEALAVVVCDEAFSDAVARERLEPNAELDGCRVQRVTIEKR